MKRRQRRLCRRHAVRRAGTHRACRPDAEILRRRPRRHWVQLDVGPVRYSLSVPEAATKGELRALGNPAEGSV